MDEDRPKTKRHLCLRSQFSASNNYSLAFQQCYDVRNRAVTKAPMTSAECRGVFYLLIRVSNPVLRRSDLRESYRR